MMTSPAPSYWRQMDWFDPSEHAEPVTIIGCGGIGSFVAMALAKLGISDFQLWDPDRVEEHNIPNQLFNPADVGKSKTGATIEHLRSIYGERILMGGHVECWTKRSIATTPIVVSAVDSIVARREILESTICNPAVKCLVDGRIGGQVAKVLALDPTNLDHVEWYKSTLDGKVVELPCTAQAVIDVAFFVTAMITRVVRKVLTMPEFLDDPVYDVLDVHNLQVARLK